MGLEASRYKTVARRKPPKGLIYSPVESQNGPIPEDQVAVIAPDGNIRGTKMGLNVQDYDDGGRKVGDLAEAVALQGLVKKLVVWILSPGNLTRTDEFKIKIIKAFERLKGRIESNGKLVRDKIRLGDLVGNIQAMEEGPSDVDRAIVKIMSETCKLTQRLVPESDARMELVFGVNAAEELAKGASLIYRTGIEANGLEEDEPADHFRSSRIVIPVGTVCVGEIPIWPDSSIQLALRAIRHSATTPRRTFEPGHKAAFIAEFLQKTQHRNIGYQRELTVPHQMDAKEIADLREAFSRERSTNNHCVIYGPNGEIAANWGNENNPHAEIIVINEGQFDDWVAGRTKATFDVIIAPGQETYGIEVPGSPGDANIFGSGSTIDKLLETIDNAIAFASETEAKHGSEKIPTVADLAEFDRYFQYGKQLPSEGTGSWRETATNIMGYDIQEASALPNEHEEWETAYNKIADIFAAYVVQWSKKTNIKWPDDFSFRAFINYAFTSFFFAYYPNHPEWGKGIEKNWEQKADMMARYMNLTYIMDHFGFDSKELSPGDKQRLSEWLKRCIQNEGDECLQEELPHSLQPLKSMGIEFNILSKELKASAKPARYQAWVEEMTGIVQGMVNELEQDVIDNPLLANIGNTDGEEVFKAKYLDEKRVPSAIRKVINQAIEKKPAKESSDIEKNSAYYDLKLFAYLTDIEKSIGSGNIYKTLACIGSKDQDVPEEAYHELNMISSLINYYFRIANDIAEKNRSKKDRDDKLSCNQILTEKYRLSGDPDPEKSAENELICIADTLKKSLYTSIDQFQTKYANNPFLNGIAVALQRARIGEMFYTGTHYRKAKRPIVKWFFNRLKDCGMSTPANDQGTTDKNIEAA